MDKPSDDKILEAVGAWGNQSPTYVVRNRLSMKGRNTKTPWVLRQLSGLEREGRVQRVPSPYAVMICWALPTKQGAL